RKGELRCRRWPRGSTCQHCSATIAELAACLDLSTTARANCRECRTALPTETGTVAVICLAPGTLHAGPPGTRAGEGRNGNPRVIPQVSEDQGHYRELPRRPPILDRLAAQGSKD